MGACALVETNSLFSMTYKLDHLSKTQEVDYKNRAERVGDLDEVENGLAGIERVGHHAAWDRVLNATGHLVKCSSQERLTRAARKLLDVFRKSLRGKLDSFDGC